MQNDTIVVTLFVLIGLAIGTMGLLTARTEIVRRVTATTGYLLAGWQLWILVFGGWHLTGGYRTAVLCLGLVAVLIEGATIVITNRRSDEPARTTAGHRARTSDDSVVVRPARHRVDTPSRVPSTYGQPYSSTADWRQPSSPMVDEDARGGASARPDAADRSYLATWSDLAGDPDWADRWTTGGLDRRPVGHRWATHDAGIIDWLDSLDR